MHQLASVAAEKHVDPEPPIERQRGHHDALRKVLPVGKLDHPLQVAAILGQEPGVEHMAVVGASGELRQALCALMVEAAGDSQADRLQRSLLDVDSSQNRACVKAARERQSKILRALS